MASPTNVGLRKIHDLLKVSQQFVAKEALELRSARIPKYMLLPPCHTASHGRNQNGTWDNEVPFLSTYAMPGPVLHILQTSSGLILIRTFCFTVKETTATHKVQFAQDDTTNNEQNPDSPPELLNSVTPSALHLRLIPQLLEHLSLLPCVMTCLRLSSIWGWLNISRFRVDNRG